MKLRVPDGTKLCWQGLKKKSKKVAEIGKKTYFSFRNRKYCKLNLFFFLFEGYAGDHRVAARTDVYDATQWWNRYGVEKRKMYFES